MISIHIKLDKFITCDRCKKREHDTGYGHVTVLDIPRIEVYLPDGWVQFGDATYCAECAYFTNLYESEEN